MATDLYSIYEADNYRLKRSRVITTPADDTYNIIRIPRYAFVKNVYLNVSTAFGVADSVTVGFTGNGEVANASYFLDAAMADASDIGFRQADIAKYFSTASGAITVTTVGGADGGVIQIFVDFTVIH